MRIINLKFTNIQNTDFDFKPPLRKKKVQKIVKYMQFKSIVNIKIHKYYYFL